MAKSDPRIARLKRLFPLALLALVPLLEARATIKAVLAKVGHPGATLDDAYIHFQYARAIAELHPFRYQAGEPISTGATSFLWPAVLALPYALGVRGEAMLWPAWILSFAALGGLAYEAHALTRPLAGRAAAVGAAAITLSFAGFVWHAASGMEVVPFAWVLARTTRLASEWIEAPDEERTRRRFGWLLGFAIAAPLMRPEGALTALVAGFAALAAPLEGKRRMRAAALAFVFAAVTPQLLYLVMTGHPTSTTAQVKLLVGNPYLPVGDKIAGQVRLFFTEILDGQTFSAEFLPKGGAPIACAGLAAIAWRGHVTGRAFRAVAVLVLALMMLAPCFYVTFLWNRLRYLWPFATGWFIGLACFARAVAWMVGWIDRRASAVVTALVCGAIAGTFVMRLDWVIDDVAASASGIDRQQVALGHWANRNLPPDARIGVNDTGAIAYFGDRRTFDVVGLTTAGEAPFWIAGPASRFEHYERLPPSALPTHFIVYPEWLGIDAVLGRELHEATVTDSSILGGRTMRVHEAKWSVLGTGALPWTPHGAIVDEIDVADIESERAHGYELLGATDTEEVVTEGNAPDGAVVVDGARTSREHDRFFARLPPGKRLRGVMRVAAPGSLVTVRLGDAVVAKLPVVDDEWRELAFDVPEGVSGDRVAVDVEGELTSYHYWFVEAP